MVVTGLRTLTYPVFVLCVLLSLLIFVVYQPYVLQYSRLTRHAALVIYPIQSFTYVGKNYTLLLAMHYTGYVI